MATPRQDAPLAARRESRLARMLSRRETGESLALFRIGAGLTVVGWLLNVIFSGVAEAIWLPESYGGLGSEHPGWRFELLGGVTPASLWVVIGLTLLSGLLVLVGFGGRISHFVLLQTFLALSHINPTIRGSDFDLIANCLWLLVLGSSTATLSLDCRLGCGRWTSNRRVAAWPRYLVIYQLVLMYFTTALQKASIYWSYAGDYGAVYYILQQPTWQRFDMSWLAWLYPLTQFGTAATWYWEASAPLLLVAAYCRATADRGGRLRQFFNRLHFRRLFVLGGVTLHLLIFVLMTIGPFNFMVFSAYICLFPPSHWTGLGRRLGRRSGPPAEPGSVSDVGSRSASPAAAARPKAILKTFVIYHLIAVTLLAVPSPPEEFDPAELTDPSAQLENAEWTRLLNRWGIDVTQEEFTAWSAATAQKYLAVRSVVLAPFKPYVALCGVRQQWHMFGGPNLLVNRLTVEVRDNGGRRPIYVQRSSEYTWRRRQLDHEHFRSLENHAMFTSHRDQFDRFSDWLATRALRDYPAADAARVVVVETRVGTPEQVRHEKPAPSRMKRTYLKRRSAG